MFGYTALVGRANARNERQGYPPYTANGISKDAGINKKI